jgi:phosphoribosylformylglycinamidine cyclo-ligase
MQDNKPIDYKSAGVDIDAGELLVKKIKPFAKATYRPEVLTGLGGFGALFEIPLEKYKQPILVSSTDGVGTKLKLAQLLNQHSTIGIDLVAMCVNDIIVSGAEPLFFLDYFACGKLDPHSASTVIQGIAKGCELAGCSLVGGETAEMPGMYHNEDYDLAGFCVGIVEKPKIIDGSRIQPGNVLIGIASSGVHSNGYSLVRKIIDTNKINLDQKLENKSLGELLLAPTHIYVKTILQLQKQFDLLGLAHITGGGLTENLPRVLPNHVKAIIYKDAWPTPSIFTWLQQQAQLDETEMLRTFNCGIGMILCINKKESEAIMTVLKKLGEQAWLIGEIVRSDDEKAFVEYRTIEK